MELRHLTYFLAVAETLNFTRAADSLHMAVSPLSRAIRELEIELGGTLFDRGTRHVRLTPAGSALLPQAQGVLSSVAGAKFSVKSMLSEQSPVSVGLRAIPVRVRKRIGACIASARSAAVIDYRASRPLTQLQQLLRGELEFATLPSQPEDPRIAGLHILDELLGLALPDIPPFSAMPEVRPADVEALTFIEHPEVVHEFFADVLAATRKSAEVNWDIPGSALSLISEGRHTALVVVNEESPAHLAMVEEGVITVPLAPRRHYPTYIVWLEQRENPRDLGPIIDRLRAEFAAPVRM